MRFTHTTWIRYLLVPPSIRRLGPKERVSYLRVKMRSWDPHTVLFWDGKAFAYHITGLSNMQEGLSASMYVFSEWRRPALTKAMGGLCRKKTFSH